MQLGMHRAGKRQSVGCIRSSAAVVLSQEYVCVNLMWRFTHTIRTPFPLLVFVRQGGEDSDVYDASSATLRTAKAQGIVQLAAFFSGRIVTRIMWYIQLE